MYILDFMQNYMNKTVYMPITVFSNSEFRITNS